MRRMTIFHLHWEDHVFRSAWPDVSAQRELCESFLKALRYFITGAASLSGPFTTCSRTTSSH
jgi:hypothetical protein